MIAKLMQYMETELPSKFKALMAEKSAKNAELTKREKDESNTVTDSKPSIKDRIKVRTDVAEKRIKVVTSASEKPEHEESPNVNIEKGKKDPSKVRCTFWPGCKKPECPFVHPKDPVD
jgi:sugar-specific transcriptional regulator TrmB